MKTNKTIRIYNDRADEFIERYEEAEISELHQLLKEFLKPRGRILDIGHGSGRDIAFLKKLGMEIWGTDPAEKFVKYVKKRFPDISDHFTITGLPNLSLPEHFPKKFDTVMLIAVWMHIPEELQNESVRNICQLLGKDGKIVLSYSTGSRDNDERFFEETQPEKVLALFERNDCKKIYSNSNRDGLGRYEIEWITEVYKKC